MTLRVKICGLARSQDAALAASLGATHIGCVLVPGSPRAVSAQQARSIFEAGGDGIVRVLVFRNAERRCVRRAARTARADAVQLHGYTEADARALERAGLPVLRVHALAPSSRHLPPLQPPPSPERPAVLDVLDGGTGRRFDWSLLGERAPHATFIAGGLSPENLSDLLRRQPWGIDLSSGVERSPGVKHRGRMEALFEMLETVA